RKETTVRIPSPPIRTVSFTTNSGGEDGRRRRGQRRVASVSKRIQPNDRYCPQCGTDTLRHAPDGTEYYGAHTQETCLEIRLARAQERAEKAEHDAIGYKVVRDRYAQWAMEWEAR